MFMQKKELNLQAILTHFAAIHS